MNNIRYPEQLVFGLDIGTRSIVGTVGYKEGELFKVVAQCVKEHETRAMMDGQIHDINQVANTISDIKHELENIVGRKLTDVCIAAAGRVLKTVTARADYDFLNETIVNQEHIHSLDLIGVEMAYDKIREETKEDKIKYYCVGYSVVHYFLNGYNITNLEGHKANQISTELLATFLPEEVIDGLYAAVEKAGLYVANLTLEPIAAINVAIPDKFRLLNIALVDVGAGTSDICITKDGSIIAYGMIPYAGDEITDYLAKKYLCDFQTAEKIKLACFKRKSVTYKDIMGLSHKLNTSEVIEDSSETIRTITKAIADKIIELNGGKSVSAVFVVGGGGKISGFTSSLAEYLNLVDERVALRGQEVLNQVEFLQEGIRKDSLLVTPIGICLNFYEQKNNFIFVQVNGQRIKLYDNSKLTIVDAAMQYGLQNEELFPKRGKPLNYTVNGIKRMERGQAGEAAIIRLNGKVAGINSNIEQNDQIEITESTVGPDATLEIRQIPEYHSSIQFLFNNQNIICPKFASVNDELVSEFYNIKDEDDVIILNYYTLEQVLQFMDVEYEGTIYVNNVIAKMEDKIYENFSISCKLEETIYSLDSDSLVAATFESDDVVEEEVITNIDITDNPTDNLTKAQNINIIVNGKQVLLQGKKSYIFVDILDFYPFDLSKPGGTAVEMTKNGQKAEFVDPICDNDVIELYWKE